MRRRRRRCQRKTERVAIGFVSARAWGGSTSLGEDGRAGEAGGDLGLSLSSPSCPTSVCRGREGDLRAVVSLVYVCIELAVDSIDLLDLHLVILL